MALIHLQLTDVGTRYAHLTDLLDLWEAGQSIMSRYAFDIDKMQKAELEAAIRLLRKHIDSLSNYDYKGWNVRDEIEAISRDPQKSVGGRGTPLKEQAPEE